MHVDIEAGVFAKEFQKVAAFASPKSPKEVLQYVMLKVDSDGVQLNATDCVTSVRYRSAATFECHSAGSILLPVSRSSKIFREAGDKTIEIKTSKNSIRIKSGNANYQLSSHNVDEFPSFQNAASERSVEMPVKAFSDLVSQTSIATDPKSLRYALSGVSFEYEDGELTAVGTDGRRMSVWRLNCDAAEPLPFNNGITIVPARPLAMMLRVIDEYSETVEISVSSSEFLIRSSNVTASTRLLDGRFPSWRQIVNKERDSQSIEFNTEVLHAAVRRASIITNEETRGIDFKFYAGSLDIRSATKDVGDSLVHLPIPWDAPPVTITLDSNYIMELLKTIDLESQIVVKVSTESDGVWFSDGNHLEHVIQPMISDRVRE